jgi:hypothetical protein
MQMRIIWGKILPGQWDAFEAAFKKALNQFTITNCTVQVASSY